MAYQSENKICQNCKQDFIIEPDDFGFYEKIKVPPPTFCPTCRSIRRLSWRNERTLYKRTCDLCEKNIIAIYSKDAEHPVYCIDCYNGDNWDPFSFGVDYNLDKNFFYTLKEISQTAPVSSLDIVNSPNCEYTNHSSNSKNCYLGFGLTNAEDSAYGNQIGFSKNIFDGDLIIKCDSLYSCVNCTECFKVFYSAYAESCLDSYFLYDCVGCSDCFGCANLRNKQYHIWNKPYSKEEYQEFIQSIDLGSRNFIKETKEKFENFLQEQPIRFAHIRHSTDCTGDNIEGSKNCKDCFGTRNGVENCKFCAVAGYGLKDTYDIFGGGLNSELGYECFSFNGDSRVMFSKKVRQSSDSLYSDHCVNCQYIFGCRSLKNKSYCIFNKQYTKEQYEEIVPKLIEFSKNNPYEINGKIYSYGEFFPTEDSSFAYNETIAQEFFPLTEEEARGKGYKWVDESERNYKSTKNESNLSDNISEIDDSILNEVIACTHNGTCFHKCTTAFKITEIELTFYRKHKIPIPTICPNCRYFERLSKRSELVLYNRQCMCGSENSAENSREHGHQEGCENKFETAYNPKRPEIIYCESCYNKEVY